MSKHVPINPAWFEPGPDGDSPFEREFYAESLEDEPLGTTISAAFRALLAEDAERMEFAAGDTVRLEDFPTNRYREHVGKHCLFKFHQGQDLAAVVIDGKIWSWELKHLTLVRKAAPVAEVQPEPLVHVDLSSQPDVTRAVQLDEHGNVLQEVTIEQLAQLGIVTKPTPPAHAVGQQPVGVGVRTERGEGMSWKETTHNGWIILAPIGRDFNSDKVFIPCKGYRDVPKLYATKGEANKKKQRGEKVVRATITTEWEDVT